MIFDLLKAYADQRKKTVKRVHVVPRRTVWSIKEARQRLESLLGEGVGDWVQLDLFLQRYGAMPDIARTARASSFGATLEMAREGLVELSQAEPFAPIYMRRREPGCDLAAHYLTVTQLSCRSRTLPKNKGTGMVPPKLNVVPQDSAPRRRARG